MACIKLDLPELFGPTMNVSCRRGIASFILRKLRKFASQSSEMNGLTLERRMELDRIIAERDVAFSEPAPLSAGNEPRHLIGASSWRRQPERQEGTRPIRGHTQA